MGWLAKDKQQQKAKMPAAGATQALRLFCNPLFAIYCQLLLRTMKYMGHANKIGHPWPRKRVIIMSFLSSLFINLISCNAKITEEIICNTNLSQMQLTKFMKFKIQKNTTVNKVEVKENLHLKVFFKNGENKDVFLDNIWKGLDSNCENRKELVEQHLSSLIDLNSNLKTLSSKDQTLIMPVVRSLEMVKEMPKSDKDYVLYNEIAGDIGVFWVVNKPNGLIYLTKMKLDEIGLSFEQLHKISVKNIKANISEVKCTGGNGLFMITAGGNFETSLLYSDTLWAQMQSNLKGNIIIGIPNRDLLFVTGSNDHENLNKLKKMMSDNFNKGSYPISLKLFLRENDNWILFEKE